MFDHLLDWAPEGNRIGVMVSGGTDSTLLLYLLLRENLTRDDPKVITLFCIPKYDGALEAAARCVQAVSEKLGCPALPMFLVGDRDADHRVIVNQAWRQVQRLNLVDHLYIADNVVPTDAIEGLAPVRQRVADPFIAQPFFNRTKDEILRRYYDLGIESLLPLTHTCTERTDSECGICWQCRERAWAFKRIGQVDPLAQT